MRVLQRDVKGQLQLVGEGLERRQRATGEQDAARGSDVSTCHRVHLSCTRWWKVWSPVATTWRVLRACRALGEQRVCAPMRKALAPAEVERAEHAHGHAGDEAPEGERGRRDLVLAPALLHVHVHAVALHEGVKAHGRSTQHGGERRQAHGGRFAGAVHGGPGRSGGTAAAGHRQSTQGVNERLALCAGGASLRLLSGLSVVKASDRHSCRCCSLRSNGSGSGDSDATALSVAGATQGRGMKQSHGALTLAWRSWQRWLPARPASAATRQAAPTAARSRSREALRLRLPSRPQHGTGLCLCAQGRSALQPMGRSAEHDARGFMGAVVRGWWGLGAQAGAHLTHAQGWAGGQSNLPSC